MSAKSALPDGCLQMAAILSPARICSATFRWPILKNEHYSLRKWVTREEARNGVIDYIERRYNRNRPTPRSCSCS